ncbi:hypothetical protein [Pedobacter ghigonis]|uniref:hypothetical protein n=1 Tax=Pedobacter ghigonis TaxID=2730403 RepID=UPI0015893B84|nr:hypothetical protein [Pedobacter ghigonis]
MGANYRETELESLIDSVVILRKLGKYEQADNVLRELKQMVGEDNKLIEQEIENRTAKNR